MRHARRLSLVLALIVVAVLAARAQDVDEVVREWMDKQHVPAVALVVMKDGAVTRAQGYGFADVENRVPTTPETVFKIGSVSKQFIATAIMLLVQDGRLSVDDRVSKYIDGTPPAWAPITIRHLLTHTAGLVREGPGFGFFKIQPDIDVIRSAFPAPLRFPTGEKYEYSNIGYFTLAEIVTRVSGKPWPEFLRERVFAPLGMSATRTTTLTEIVPNRARGYAWTDGALRNAEDGPAVRPSGAFLSTVTDLAKWEQALEGDRILTAASKKEMWTPVRLNDGKPYPYGLGWQLDDWPAGSPAPTGVPMIRHGGSMSGFRAGYVRWPRQRLTVIVLTNSSNAQWEGLAASVAIRHAPELKSASR
jgi:CubicO group peptidase (beta-lactamase class C family)